MAYNTTGNFTAGQCVAVLQDLTDLEGNMHSPLMKQTPTGYLEAITSPLNTDGQEAIQLQDTGGKKREVRIRYMVRTIESQVDSSITRTCNEGDFDNFLEVTFDCDKELEHRVSLNETDFQRICDGQADFTNKILRKAFDALARTVNRDILTDQSTNFGLNVNTGLSTARDITVFAAANGNPIPRALQVMFNDYTVGNQSVDRPLVIGAGNIYDFWTTLKAGCCNDGGVDMLELSNILGFSPFLDTMIEGVVGANNFAVLEPGTVQFVRFNEYVGEREKLDSPFVSNTTITDPRRNVTYDLKILFDECTDNWTFIFRLCYGIFFRPGDAWDPADPLDNTNGTLRFRAITS